MSPPPPPPSSMATNSEEFFVEGPMEPKAPTSCLLLDTPLQPNIDSGEDPLASVDIVLPYISSVLMEDDIDDKLSCLYSDHPALQQMQQTFAQIVYSPSFGANNDNGNCKGDTKGSNNLLQDANGDQTSITSAFCKGDEAVSFLKGIQVVSDCSPKDNDITKDDLVNEAFSFRERSNNRGPKKRYNRYEHLEEDEVGRSSKATVVRQEPEETSTHEIFDDLMLRGYETCLRNIERLRIAMADEVENKNRDGGSKSAWCAVDLHTLLKRCAQAVDANDYMSARELLKQVKQHASAKGDASQRLAHYFLKGLEARLVGTGSQLPMAAERLSVTEYVKAVNQYMAACSFNKVALAFNVWTILHVMKGRNKLHVVDYGLHHGFHWACLLRVLAHKKTNPPPEVKITAIGCTQLRSFPAEWFEETGRRLSMCARAFGLPSFEFHVVKAKWEDVCIDDLNTDTGEVLVVNELFNFSTLMDESVYFDDPSPRDTVLSNVRRMRPEIFIQGVVNCSYGTSFLTRFREALFYYSAMFDVLDATMPRGSEQRLVLEQDFLGPCALNVIACEGTDRMDRSNTYKQWQLRNQRAGLRQVPLVPEVVSVVKDVVKGHRYHKDFVIDEDHRWLLQGWKGRILYAHSTWVADDAFAF